MLPAPLYRSNLLLHKVLNRSAPPVHRLQSESRYFLPRESGLMTWNGLVGSMGLAASLLGCGPSAIQQQSQSAAGRLAPTRAVAVAPLRVPEELAGYESELARLDSLIFFELETAGLYVTGPKVYGRLWDKIASARGGFYNPLTGALNTALLDSAQAQLAAILDMRLAHVGHGGDVVVALAESRLREGVLVRGQLPLQKLNSGQA